MKEEMTWKTGTGQEAKIIIELRTRKTVYADGHNVEVDCHDIYITAYIDNQEIGWGYPMTTNNPVAVAKIGKLGLTQETMNRFDRLYKKFKKPEIKSNYNYDGGKSVYDAMTLNGTTY